MPTSAATRSAVSRASPVSSTGVSPSAFSSRDRLGARRLDGVADGERRARHAVPARPRSRRRGVRPSTVVAVDDAADADARPRCGSRSRPAARRARHGPLAATACAIGCSDAASTAPARRSTSARVAPFSSATSASSIFPSVTVPVLSRTIVVDPPRLLEHLRALDEDAELRAAAGSDHQRRRRREPHRARAGDDQDGDGGREGRRGRGAGEQPARERRERERRCTIGTKIAETRSASRCTDALPACACSTRRAICASAVSAPTLRRADDEPAGGVDRRAGDLGAGADLDRHRLAGQHRLVDRGRALDDDAVGRDLLARPDDEHVADAQLARWARAPPRRRAGRAPPSRRARAARGSPRPSGGVARASKKRPSRISAVTPRRPRSTCRRRGRRAARPSTTSRPRACRARRACPSSRRRAARSAARRGGSSAPRPEDDRRRERERRPTPSRENCSGVTIASSASGTESATATISRVLGGASCSCAVRRRSRRRAW